MCCFGHYCKCNVLVFLLWVFLSLAHYWFKINYFRKLPLKKILNSVTLLNMDKPVPFQSACHGTKTHTMLNL